MAWHLMRSLEKENYDRQYKDKELIRRLVPYILQKKVYFFSVIILFIFSSILYLLSPIFFAVGLNELSKELVGKTPNRTVLAISTGGYLILLVLEWVVTYYADITEGKLSAYIIFALRKDLFVNINDHDLSFFDKNKTGLLMSRITNDTSELGNDLMTVAELGSTILNAGLILIALLFLNVPLTLAALIVFPILFFLTYLLRKLIRKYATRQQRVTATLNAFVEESVSGITITKSFSQEENVLKNFKDFQKQKVVVNIQRSIIGSMFSPVFDFITAIGVFIILIGGGISVFNGGLTVGFLYLFITYLRRLFSPIITLSTFYTTLQGGFAAAERIFSMMDVPTEMKIGLVNCPPLNGEIEFKNINFSYEESREPVFKNLNLHINVGQTVAVVGETGAGKTSFAGLLTRMYDYQSGTIILDNKYDIRDLDPDSLRDQVGYVLQEPFLFSGTILDNLLLASPNATEENVQKALTAVGADSFINLLSEGINTKIMERGKGLSQGQKQLLSLARILLKDPKILILDDATSSVDAYTEKMIQDALRVVMTGRTTIVIAHRLSTVINADRILVMDKGEIIEDGKHEELINQFGKYRELYQNYYAFQGALKELTV